MMDAQRQAKLKELRDSRPGGKVSDTDPNADGTLPSYWKEAFVCPHCNAYAHQLWTWAGTRIPHNGGSYSNGPEPNNLTVAFCQHCRKESIWKDKCMVYPACSTAPMPSPDMPEDVKADYLEARDVFEKSPRSAGGLLRIAFEKLLPHIGATKSNPNDAIGELVKGGLPLTHQQALDVMRIFGNQSVHIGFVKLEDQPATVGFLFNLLNYIVGWMITRTKQVEAMFGSLPPDKVAGIEKRDGKK